MKWNYCDCNLCRNVKKLAQKKYCDNLAKKMVKNDIVTVTVDIPDDVLLQIALLAHESDMKLNDYIVKTLENYVERKKFSKKLKDWYKEQENIKDLRGCDGY